MTTIYISGPMRGEPENGREHFERVDQALKRLGFRTVNPWALDVLIQKDWSRREWGTPGVREYLSQDLLHLLRADAVYVIAYDNSRGEPSLGVEAEVAVAEAANIPVYHTIEELLEAQQNENL